MNSDYVLSFEIKDVPNKDFNKIQFFESMGNSPFILSYDFSTEKSIISLPADDAYRSLAQIEKSIPGLTFNKCDKPLFNKEMNASLYYIYRKSELMSNWLMNDIFSIGVTSGTLNILFMPKNYASAQKQKERLERILSEIPIRENNSVRGGSLFSSKSLQNDLFGASEEKDMLIELLESINSSLLSNGKVYKICIFASGCGAVADSYIKSKFLVLNFEEMRSDIHALLKHVDNSNGLIFGIQHALSLLSFYGIYGLKYVIPTKIFAKESGIALGTYMKDAAVETEKVVAIDKSSLNLGCIISGLPGSGKTMEGMAIVDAIKIQAKNESGDDAMIAILSPTSEWNDFAKMHNMQSIRIYDDGVPINFFKCPYNSNPTNFSENLAMLLASVSDAGPYKNPLEKCLLNAFRAIYSKTLCPDPISVYYAIQESIIKLHGKKTNTGTRYTKHGENIKSALENLAGILNRDEYASIEGIDILESLKKGVVFDLSNLSIKTRSFMYALIMNQIYSVLSGFEIDGDNNLRALLCIEEAQIVFGLQNTAAVEDLKYRLQDFRKKGIGLMLMVHNINDIDPNIRRLCQIKLYLKQASDVAPIACKDLVFTYAEDSEVVSKLKHLNSRTGALNYVVKNGDEKLSQDTIFIKTKYYQNELLDADKDTEQHKSMKYQISARQHVNSRISLSADVQQSDKHPIFNKLKYVRIMHLGEELISFDLEKHNISDPVCCDLLEGAPYTMEFLDERGKTLASAMAVASDTIKIVFKDSKVLVL